jgi:hypothetical protein
MVGHQRGVRDITRSTARNLGAAATQAGSGVVDCESVVLAALSW